MPPTSRPLSTALDHARAAGCGRVGPTDADLLARYVATRDEAAFGQLVRRHGRLVLGVARRRLADRHAAEDVVQATFLALARQAGRLRPGTALPAWLHTVAYRLALKALAAAARQPTLGATDTAAPGADPLTEVTGRELVGMIDEELARLPEAYRLPLLLCGLDGLSRDEAASRLGWTLGALRGRLERGRDLLRARLARRGVAPAAAGLFALVASEATAAISPDLVRAAVRAAVGIPERSIGTVARTAVSAMGSHGRLAVLAAGGALVLVGVGVAALALPGAPPADSPQRPAAQPTPPADPAGGVTIRGRVLDPDGKPVAGARLFTYRRPAEPRPADDRSGLVQRAVTGADGHFSFSAPGLPIPLPANQTDLLRVVAAADGFGVGWAKPDRPDQEVTVRVPPDQPIVGRVLNTEGRPAAGATVRVREFTRERTGRLDRFLTGWQANWMDALYADSEGGLNDPPASAVRVTGPDPEGRFRITGVGAESVALLDVHGPGLARAVLYVLTRPGYDPGPANRATLERIPPSLRFPGQPPLLYGPSFDFVAQPAKAVEGTVREAGSGRPVAGARVSAAAGYNVSLDATTDGAGRFRITGMSKQKDYHVYIGPTDRSPLIARTFQLPDTDGLQPVRADLELARGVVVAGRVVDRETGEGVHCSLGYVPLPGNTFIRRPEFAAVADRGLASSTDEAGYFRFPVLPGPGVLMAQAHGRDTLDGHEVNPYVGAKFDEENHKHVPVLVGGAGEPVFATAGGTFQSIAHESAVKRLDLVEGGEAVTVNVFVYRGRTTAVRLRNPDGRPVVGAVVAGMTAMWPTTFTLPQAECTVYALDPAKPRTVVFYHAGQKLAGSLTVRGDEAGPLTARLGPTGAITGRVLDADGQPVAGAAVGLMYWDETARELDRHLRQRKAPHRTDAAGRFRVDGIVPDVNFEPVFRKGPTTLTLQPRGPSRQVGAGATLDLGDLRPQQVPP